MKHLFFLTLFNGLIATVFSQNNAAAKKAWAERAEPALLNLPYLYALREDRALAYLGDGKYELLDSSLQKIALPMHTRVNRDYDGFLLVQYFFKFGLLDYDGRLIAPVAYDRIWVEEDCIKLLKNNQLELRSHEGKLLWEKKMPPGVRIGEEWQDTFFEAYNADELAGIMDTSGQWRIQPTFESISYKHVFKQPKVGYWQGDNGFADQYVLLPWRSWQSKTGYAQLGPVNENGYWAKQNTEASLLWYGYDEKAQPSDIVEIRRYSDIYFTFKKGNKWGLMNEVGLELLPAAYHRISPKSYESQVGVVQIDLDSDNEGVFYGDKWWLLPRYNNIANFKDGLIATRGDSAYIFDHQGTLQHQIYVTAPIHFAGEYVWSRTHQNRVWHSETGWIDLGIDNVSDDYGYVRGARDPLMINQNWSGNWSRYLTLSNRQGKMSLMDKAGKRLLENVDGIHPLFYEASRVLQGYSFERAFEGNGWVIPQQQIVVPPQYAYLRSKGKMVLAQKQFKYGVLDYRGREVLPFEYEEINMDLENAFALKKDGQWYWYDTEGLPLSGGPYTEIRRNGSHIWGKTPAGWKLLSVHAKGRMANTLFQEFPIETGHNGFIFSEKGKFGLVDIEGNVLQPFEWDTLVLGWGRKGKIIKLLECTNCRLFEVEGDGLSFIHHGYYLVQRNGLQYILTAAGKPLSTEGYLNVIPSYANASARFLAEKTKDSWHVLDCQGKLQHTLQGQFPHVSGIVPNTLEYQRGDENRIFFLEKNKDDKLSFDLHARIATTSLYIVKERPVSYDVMRQEKPEPLRGLVDGNLLYVLPIEYKDIQTISNNRFILATHKTGKSTVYDLNMQVCIPEDFYSYDFYGNDEYENFIKVIKDNKIGVYIIDQKKWIPAAMDEIRSCNVRIPLGKAAFLIRSNGKYGLMDSDCREIVLPEYDEIKVYGEDLLVLVKDQKHFLYHTLQQKMLPDSLDKIERVGKNHLIGIQGNRQSVYRGLERIYSATDITISIEVNDELMRVFDKKTSKYGLARMDGTVVVPIIYKNLRIETDVVITAVLGDKKEERFGFLDFKGNVIVPFEHSEGSAKKGYIAARKSTTGKWGTYDLKGNPILPHEFGGLDEDYVRFGFILTRINTTWKWGAFDLKGKQVLPHEFDEIRIVEDSHHFICKNNGKFRYYFLDGRPMHDTEWDFADAYINGFAVVGQGDKFGYIDPTGQLTIPLQFRYANRFGGYGNSRYALVIKDKRHEFIGIKGDSFNIGALGYFDYEVTDYSPKPIYDPFEYKPPPPVKYLPIGYTASSDIKTGKVGVMNILGEWVLLPQYDQILISSGEYGLGYQTTVLAFMKEKDKWGMIGYNGKVLLPPTYDTIEYLGDERRFKVTLDGKASVVTMNYER